MLKKSESKDDWNFLWASMIGIYDFTFAFDGLMWMLKESLPVVCFKASERSNGRNSLIWGMWLGVHPVKMQFQAPRSTLAAKILLHFPSTSLTDDNFSHLSTRATDALAGLLFFLPAILKLESPFPFGWLRFYGNLRANQDIASLFNLCMSSIEPCALAGVHTLVACANWKAWTQTFALLANNE